MRILGDNPKGMSPSERVRRGFVIEEVDKAKINAFVKCPNIRSLGDISPAVTVFHDALQTACGESMIEQVRQWGEKHSDTENPGRVTEMMTALTNARVALAVALASKAYFIKIPKATDRKEKVGLVNKAKAQIEKAKLGKAPCLSVETVCVCV